MKKYLMMVVAALAFAGCAKNEIEFLQPPTGEEPTDKDLYDAAFKAYIGGTIPTTQSWGFSETGTASAPSHRAANTNSNQWEDQGYTIPADITPAELEKVLEVFNQEGATSYTSLINLDEFFVQQVYKGVATYTDKAGNTGIVGSDKMDWLCTVTNKHVNVISWSPYEEEVTIGEEYDDHINNFNNGNCTATATSEKTGKAIKGMQLMYSSNTNKFGFKASQDNGHVFYNFRMEEIDGNYYVGFDFEAAGQNPNEQVDRDYIYNDWIVKIVPGKGNVEKNLRILCEDLSATSGSDFDFNDVVLDVKMGDPAVLTLRAAGGTLPIRIDGNDAWEVHKLFGVWVGDDDIAKNTDKQVMVNTGIVSKPAVVVPNFNKKITTAAEANAIKIEVYKNGKWQEMTAVKGEPASKLAVDNTFQWLPERKSIKDEYLNFVTWATATGFTSKWW